MVRYHESVVAVTSKYSLGNCDELATQAFEYVLNHDNISAEKFRIAGEGGDHVFVVINRDPSSDPNDPLSWGENAVICDTWAANEADQVYPASEYKTHLKNFYHRDGKNQVEPINLKQHQLIPVSNYNTAYFHNQRTISNLKDVFLEETWALCTRLQQCVDGLEKEKIRLEGKNGQQAPKIEVLSKKIKQIKDTMKSIKEEMLKVDKKKEFEDYNLMLNQEYGLIRQKSEVYREADTNFKDAFLAETEALRTRLQQCVDGLEEEKKICLEVKNDQQAPKIKALSNKIKQITDRMILIKEEMLIIDTKEFTGYELISNLMFGLIRQQDYREARSNLQNQYNDYVRQAKQSVVFSDKEQAQLFGSTDHPNDNNILSTNLQTITDPGNFNSLEPAREKAIDNRKEILINETQELRVLIDLFKNAMMVEKSRLTEKYGENDKRIDILDRKIAELDKLNDTIPKQINSLLNNNFNFNFNYDYDYDLVDLKLNEAFDKVYKQTVDSLKFSDEDQTNLDLPVGNIRTFMGWKSTCGANVRSIFGQAEEMAKKIDTNHGQRLQGPKSILAESLRKTETNPAREYREQMRSNRRNASEANGEEISNDSDIGQDVRNEIKRK